MTIVTRFAPSPTGFLHVGNARAALVSWLFARRHGGTFILRIDDTDYERSKDEYTDAIKRDLTWLGLDWDRYAHQRGREDRYAQAVAHLKAVGRLYACYETEEELALKRKALLNQGLPPIYDRAALRLTPDQIAKYEAEGRKPHWRFKMDHAAITWRDLIRGEVKFEGKDIADPVLIREDGTPLYHICSVIDDIDYGITHVLRGEDHVTNTAFHIQMFQAMGATVPIFAHWSMFTGADGAKLSKRNGALSIAEMRDEYGIEAMAFNSVLSRLGTSQPVEAFADLAQIAAQFDITQFSRAATRFSFEEIQRINAKILHGMSYEAIRPRLEILGLGQVDESLWLAARENIAVLRDLTIWQQVIHGPINVAAMSAEDRAFVAQAVSYLPATPWDATTWTTWIEALKAATGRKGKALFMPLRQALTGMDHGPEMAPLLPLIGEEKVRERLG